MSLRLSRLGRFVVILAVAAASVGRSSVRPPSAPVFAQRYYPEVRLRKMHLVRPDLIPYPISFDVYC